MGCASSVPDTLETTAAKQEALPVPVEVHAAPPISLELKLYYARALEKRERERTAAVPQVCVLPVPGLDAEPNAGNGQGKAPPPPQRPPPPPAQPPPAAVRPPAAAAQPPAAEKDPKKAAKPKPAPMTRLERYYAEAYQKLQQPHTCNICMEENIQLEMMCARGSPEKLTVQQARDGCGHFACKDCMQAYVTNCIENRKFPILCPNSAGGCSRWVMYGDVINLISASAEPKNLQALQQLEVEHAIPLKDRMYCPYKDCSTLLMKSAKPCASSQCLQCKRDFCPNCLFEGRHEPYAATALRHYVARTLACYGQLQEGYTCAQVLALPADQKNPQLLGLLTLVKEQEWKACPKCKMVVERIDGCNYVHCRCGCGFCYKCGLQYKTTTATAKNVHGTPACKCGLFSYVFDD